MRTIDWIRHDGMCIGSNRFCVVDRAKRGRSSRERVQEVVV